MSDMTALSHEYETSASFAERVNAAVLQVKKACFHRDNMPEPAVDALADSSKQLANILGELAVRLASLRQSGDQIQLPQAMEVPEEVLERIENKQRSRLAYFIEDLELAAEALAGKGKIDNRVLGTLDEVCEAADAIASAMFRRLRRR